MNNKNCSKCKENKDLSEFYKDKYTTDGHTSACRECIRQAALKPDIKERKKIYNREYNDQPHIKVTRAEYRAKPENKARAAELQRGYRSTPIGKIKLALRNNTSRLRNYITNGSNPGSSQDGLGCSLESFKFHLYDSAYDRYGDTNPKLSNYCIDHIIPLACLNLNDPAHIKIAKSYQNFQLLDQEDNGSKSDNLDLFMDRLTKEQINFLNDNNIEFVHAL